MYRNSQRERREEERNQLRLKLIDERREKKRLRREEKRRQMKIDRDRRRRERRKNYKKNKELWREVMVLMTDLTRLEKEEKMWKT
eukprot:CAMPEP_0203708926 /NCGR_PEP_ID=MMETSP0091-20130426/60446_1 /ASSEMBLY_ACC=CAM_ASM_001089 /TAXON_ID=426623 /ORGANISM="Chaetoceros affinis, Strain CCMP159" /LENGTH=84 /DNA_ID=CAMNT_0050585763 /DNA_START=24 /DNA_END=274 /DNA_ORIENTATION=+